MSSIKKWLSLSKGEGKFLDLKSPDFEPISGEVSHLAISGVVSTVAKRNPYVFLATGLVHAGSHFLSKVLRGDDVYTVTNDNIIWQNPVHIDISESPASSASSYQQHGGARGNQPSRRFKNIDAIPAGSRVTKPIWKTISKHAYGGVKSGYHHCKKGWLLVRVGDTNMCWKPPRRK